MSEDRREYPRAAFEVHVHLQSEHNFFTGFAENISDGGLFISTEQPLAVGEVVAVAFTLPSGRRIEASSEVQWVRHEGVSPTGDPPGMGVRFRFLSPEDQQAIHEFMGSRPPIFIET